MGKKIKSTKVLTAKLLAVLLVLQAVLFSVTAFGSTVQVPNSLVIKRGATDVTGTAVSVLRGSTVALTSVLSNATTPSITSATYKVSWTSNSTSATIANVNLGSIVAASTGVAVITAAEPVTGLTKTVTLAIYEALKTFTASTTLTLKLNQTGYAPITAFSPSNADVTSTVYAISNVSPAGAVTIDPITGLITAVAPGSATIKVTKTLPAGQTDKSVTFKVTVPQPVTSVAISTDGKTPVGATLGINIEDKTINLKAIFNAATGKIPTDKGVTWSVYSSTSTSISITSTGALTVTGAAYGATATIKLTAKDTSNSAVATVDITIVHKLTGIKLPQSSLTLRYNETGKQISPATLLGTTPTITGVTYTSDKPSVAGVTVTGQVYSVGSGTAKITVKVTAADGTFKTAVLPVTVSDKITAITISVPSTTLKLYSKATIKSTFQPTTAKYNYARFTSSNPSVAFVNPLTGEVTAIAVGTTDIKSTAENTVNSNTITITVSNPDGLE
jgi:hypothetical protein